MKGNRCHGALDISASDRASRLVLRIYSFPFTIHARCRSSIFAISINPAASDAAARNRGSKSVIIAELVSQISPPPRPLPLSPYRRYHLYACRGFFFLIIDRAIAESVLRFESAMGGGVGGGGPSCHCQSTCGVHGVRRLITRDSAARFARLDTRRRTHASKVVLSLWFPRRAALVMALYAPRYRRARLTPVKCRSAGLGTTNNMPYRRTPVLASLWRANLLSQL